MSAIQHTDGSGRQAKQPSDIQIIRDLQKRVEALERAIASSQGITFVSPDGNTTRTLSVDNTGAQVWA